MKIEVEHYRYGRGVVELTVNRGFLLLVRFGQKAMWLRRDEVRFLTPLPSVHPKTLPPKQLADDSFTAREMIEALRLGTVPHKSVEKFIFGREDEIRAFNRWLDTPEEKKFLLVGEYGSGKTHLLQYLYHVLPRMNFAVCYTEIDPTDAPLHRPKRVYERLIESFRYSGGGFREFLTESAKNNNCEQLYKHEFLGELIYRLKNGKSVDDEFLWLEGKDESRWAGLYDHGTASNIYCYLFSTFSWIARKILGLKGLVLIFDEAENIDIMESYIRRGKGINFLKGLYLTAQEYQALLEENIIPSDNTQFSTYRGERTGLIYNGFKKVRYLYQPQSGLKIIFAFTSYKPLDKLDLGNVNMFLEKLLKQVHKQIFDSIYNLYKLAYPDVGILGYAKEELYHLISRKKLKEATSNIRVFVKTIIETFDLLRHYPSLKVDMLFKV